MKDVAELFLLGPQIVQIVGVRLDLEGYAFDDLDTVATDARPLARVVRQDPDLRHAKIGEDLGAHAVVAQIGSEAEPVIRFDRVEAFLVLELVGLDLVLEADPATFLAHVEDDPRALFRDHPHSGIELLAAVAAERSEGVSRQALAVDADQDRLVGVDVAEDERHVVDVVDVVLEDDRVKLAETGREPRRRSAMDEALVAQAVGHQILDRHDLERVLTGEFDEIGKTRHRAVVVHDLADDTGRTTAREPRKVDGAFGLPDTAEHSALAGAKRKDVTGADDVRRLRVLGHSDLDRAGTIGGGDARRHAFTRFDRDRERRPERRRVFVVGDHHAEVELLELLLFERQADQPPPVFRHEVDRLGRDLVRRHAEIALVLPVLVVDEDHHLARGNIGDGFGDGREAGSRSRLENRSRRTRLRGGAGVGHARESTFRTDHGRAPADAFEKNYPGVVPPR